MRIFKALFVLALLLTISSSLPARARTVLLSTSQPDGKESDVLHLSPYAVYIARISR
jgi:hypothetical protein